MDFAAFMKENALPVENERLVVSKRFVDDKGNPALWEIRAITNEENSALRKSYTRTVPAPGKAGARGQTVERVDTEGYMAALVAACVVQPALESAALQDSYQVKDATQLLRRMLTPGEYDDLAFAVQKLCGFDVTLDDKVDEAKNS